MANGSSRKHGHNKRKPSNVAYKAQGRAERNKKLRAARQARIEAGHASKRSVVAIKRKQGAVARLQRRINAGKLGLSASLAKAAAALASAQGGA